MAYIYRLIILVLLGISVTVQAAVPKRKLWESVDYPSLGKFDTPSDVCYAILGFVNTAWNGGGVLTNCEVNGDFGQAHIDRGSSPYRFPIRGGGTACPSNSVASGSECECSEGFKEQAGLCTSDVPPTASEECAMHSYLWNAWSYPGDRVGQVKDARPLPLDDPFMVCMPMKPELLANGGGPNAPAGCKHKFTPQVRYRMSEDEPYTYEGDSWAVGPPDLEPGQSAACVPGLNDAPGDPDIPKRQEPKKGCEGGYAGQVNGVDVCIDRASGQTEGVNWTQVKDAEGRTREIKEEVKCQGEKCTVKTTNKTPGSSDPGTTTTTTTTRGQYCNQNPQASVCAGATDRTGSTRNQNGRGGPGDPAGGVGKGKGGGNGDGDGEGSSFGGSCKSNFTCEGDAIQCAIAKEQHIRACKMFDDPSDESQLYDQHKGKEGNQTDDLPGNDTVSLSGGGMIDTSDALGGGSCIADKTVTVWNRSVTLPFSQVCADLAMFGNLLVAVSMLLAGRIVTRG